MLDNIRRKRSQISNALYRDVLLRLCTFSPKVPKTNLGKLRLGGNPVKSFRYFGQEMPVSYELCDVDGAVFKMLECPAGVFKMGDADRTDWGFKQIWQIIERPFLLGQTEVTQELYKAVMGSNPSKFKDSPQNPVERVRWFKAVDFCNRLSALQGLEACYSLKKVKIGIFRFEMPSEKKELDKYNQFYAEIRNYILESIEKNNPYGVEFEIEYDPNVSTCDGIVTATKDDERYSIKVEKSWGKIVHLWHHLGTNKYRLINSAKEALDIQLLDFLKIPIISCDFTKNGYRLPTGREWEYAAKAGTDNRWSGTDNKEEVQKYAVCVETQTHPVKSKAPNEWDFYDMSGNVKEWCWDKSGTDSSDPNTNRISHGGCWASDKLFDFFDLRNSHGIECVPSKSDGQIGFRICRTVVS